jgi:hypothetical protein
MNYAKKKSIVIAGLLLTFMLLVAACSTSQEATSGNTSPLSRTTQANVTLSHVPSGTSDLKWDAASQTLTVKVSLSGLAPKSTHPAHIHKGDCKSNGAILYTLEPVVADSVGVGTSETTITQVNTGIPQSGWYLNVHNGGSGLTPELQDAAIACGNIANANTSTRSDQSVHLPLGSTSATNQAASGSAKLSLDSDKLTVQITLSGLEPNSTHMAHIHKGSCEAQGGVLYPLNPVVADASGKGTSTTTVDQVASMPGNSWYVNVHLGGTKDELSTQTGDDPIACGNVVIG